MSVDDDNSTTMKLLSRLIFFLEENFFSRINSQMVSCPFNQPLCRLSLQPRFFYYLLHSAKAVEGLD
jgi:hypothetical protein